MTKKISFEDALILDAARCSSFLLRLLPVEVVLWMARRVGDAVYFFSKRRPIALKNLRFALGAELAPEQIDRIARRSFHTMAMSLAELLRFPSVDDAYVKKNLSITGTHHYEPYLKSGQGAIFLTGHFGNWELLSIAGSLLGRPVVALARRQKHPRSDDFLNSLRASKGTQMILKGMPVRELIRALGASKIVGMLSDQDGGKNGVRVDFFGRHSSTPRGAAAFALRTRAPILPVFVVREGNTARHRIEVEAPLKLPEVSQDPQVAERDVLQQFASILESKVRRHPSQWLWAHRRWKSAPDLRILILGDQRTGHLNQSLALLREIKLARAAQGLDEYIRHHVIQVRFKSAASKFLLKGAAFIFGKRAPFRRTLLRWALDDASLRELLAASADIVVSCGSGLGAMNLLIAAENFAKSAVIMRPLEPARYFDAVIAPKHDKIRASANIFLTEIAPSTISENEIALQAEVFRKDLGSFEKGGSRKIGLLVGGDTEKTPLSRSRFEAVLKGLLRYSSEENAAVLVTSSRRTPLWADQLLKESFGDRGRCPLLVIANESNRPGVVAGILGLSDTVIVSGESMSMVSEAVASGKRVIVFMPSAKTRVKPKYKEFLDRMNSNGLVTVTDPENIYRALKTSASSADGSGGSLLENDRRTLRRAVTERLLP